MWLVDFDAIRVSQSKGMVGTRMMSVGVLPPPDSCHRIILLAGTRQSMSAIANQMVATRFAKGDAGRFG
jgi:hypothetical protein